MSRILFFSLTVTMGSLGGVLWAGEPWWDDFPVLVQTTDAAQATRVHASAALCGAANDPAWGLFAQRLGIDFRHLLCGFIGFEIRLFFKTR